MSASLLPTSTGIYFLSSTCLEHQRPGPCLQWPWPTILQDLLSLTPYLPSSPYSHHEYPLFLHMSSNVTLSHHPGRNRNDHHRFVVSFHWESKHKDNLPVQYATRQGPRPAAVYEVMSWISYHYDPNYWHLHLQFCSFVFHVSCFLPCLVKVSG